MVAVALLVALLLLVPRPNTVTGAHNGNFVERIEQATFSSIIAQNHMVAIYFRNAVDGRMSAFLNGLAKAAGDLVKYDVVVGLNDCTDSATAVPEFCTMPDVHESLYVFRNSEFLINVNLKALFDKSAIISNLLTLRLVDKVHVAQTAADRLRAEQTSSGKCLIHGSFIGIGIPEHTAFMKVAYDHRDDAQVRFIFGTNRDGAQELAKRLGLDDGRLEATTADRAVVIVTCYGADASIPATSHFYSGSVDYDSFGSFINALGQPDVVDIGENPGMTEYAAALAGRRLVLVAVYDRSARSLVDEVVHRLTEKFYKIFTAVLTDREGVHNVANYVQLTASDLAMTPVYCLASRGKPRCDTTIVGKDIETALYDLSATIAAFVKPTAAQSEAIDEHESLRPPEGVDPELELRNAVETQDDQVAIHASTLNVSADLPGVPALTRTTFYDSIQSATGLLVLFHVRKFDPSSVIALDVLGTAKKHLLDSGFDATFATVDCFDWTDVCTNASVREYPTLRIYRHGLPSQPLTVPVSVQGFVTAGKLASVANPAYLQAADEADRFVTASVLVRKSDSQTSAAFSEHSLVAIGAFGSSNEAAGFLQASAKHEGTAAFGVAFGAVAEQLLARHGAGHASMPAVIAFNVYKGKLAARGARVYGGNASDITGLEKFLLSSKLPALVELTPAALPVLRARALPIVLLFTEADNSAAAAVVEDVARQPLFDGALSFAYLPRHSYGAQTILAAYWPERTILPALVVVDFSQGAVHRYEDEPAAGGFGKDAVIGWLSSVLAGTSMPQSHLGSKQWLPAHPGYDFLALAEHGPSMFQHDRLTRPHQQQPTASSGDAAGVGTTGHSGSSMATEATATVPDSPGPQSPSQTPAVQHMEL